MTVVTRLLGVQGKGAARGWGLFAGALGAMACAGPPPAAEPDWRHQRELRAPPKPGSSITHTRMCECRSCDPAACCEGTEYEEAPAACRDDSYDDYDFTQACGLSIKSCSSRCFAHVWRVPQNEPCDPRPSVCCG